MMMNQTELDKVKRIIKSHQLYSKNFLKIKTKQGELKPLVYNDAQEILDRIWREQEEAGKPVRLIILKARREGISTYIQSRFFYNVANRKYKHAKVIAHDIDTTEQLFDISKTYHNELPDTVSANNGNGEQLIKIKPTKKYSNRRELSFIDTNSKLSVETAGGDSQEKSSSVGRGQTIQYLHCSEVPHWPAPKQTLISLLQTVDYSPGTVVVLESTANGIGDEFHRRWLAAKNKESDYIPVFIPWWIFKTYRLDLEPEETLEHDDEEKSLIKRFNLTDEQLKWRRKTIANECNGDVEQFHQEYPSDDQEAFIVSGRPFFNKHGLMALRDKHQKPPIKRGYLNWNYPENKLAGGVNFVEDDKGYISIWSEPKQLGCYCIGADVAEGLEKGDYSSADVLDRDTFEQAAQWHGHIDPDLYGEELVKLAIYYNRCWIGPEINNHGISTNKTIAKLRYPRLFIRKVLDEKAADPTDKLGWRTDTQSRPLMLDELEKAIREETIIINSEGTISECFTFVRNDKGKPEAQADCFDDRVISMGITIQMHKLCPMSRPEHYEDNTFKPHTRRRMIEPSDVRSEVTGY